MQESHPKELRTMVSTIQHFLARFHLADDVDTVFTNGCCYWFAVILHCRFPDSTLMLRVRVLDDDGSFTTQDIIEIRNCPLCGKRFMKGRCV